jgi:hypothetical protein
VALYPQDGKLALLVDVKVAKLDAGKVEVMRICGKFARTRRQPQTLWVCSHKRSGFWVCCSSKAEGSASPRR